MNLQKKIDNIRQKPEHIRLRWAWFLSISFTLIIIFIWIISVRINNTKKDTAITPEEENFMEEFKKDKKSLKDATQGIKNTTDTLKEMSTNSENYNSEGFAN